MSRNAWPGLIRIGGVEYSFDCETDEDSGKAWYSEKRNPQNARIVSLTEAKANAA